MTENIILEHDEKSRYALVLRKLEKRNEYVVAYGYDPEAGDWAQGHYHETLEGAVVDYNRCIGGVAIEIAPDDCFCTVRWCDEDILRYIEERKGEAYATAGNVERCKGKIGKSLKDRSIEEGWEIIDAILSGVELEERR